VVIDGYRLANSVVQASLTAGSYAALPQAIHAIANGDGSAALTDPAAVAAARQALPDLPAEELLVELALASLAALEPARAIRG
jgi:hypothetical protein